MPFESEEQLHSYTDILRSHGLCATFMADGVDPDNSAIESEICTGLDVVVCKHTDCEDRHSPRMLHLWMAVEWHRVRVRVILAVKGSVVTPDSLPESVYSTLTRQMPWPTWGLGDIPQRELDREPCIVRNPSDVVIQTDREREAGIARDYATYARAKNAWARYDPAFDGPTNTNLQDFDRDQMLTDNIEANADRIAPSHYEQEEIDPVIEGWRSLTHV
ncbi:hypothetical protein KIPB_012074, partial [Kipferlia bialata]|eukprot:g12074.t1